MTTLATRSDEAVAAEAWTRSDVRRLAVAGAVLAAVLTTLHAVTTSKHFVDLQVYRMGASAFLHGHDPYTLTLGHTGLPYTYTPFSAVAFAPLSGLPLGLAAPIQTFVSIVSLFAVVFLVTREVAAPTTTPLQIIRGSLLCTACLYWSEPILQTLGFGQINLVLMGLVVVDLLALRSTRAAGVLIGIAAGIKLTPLVFVLYLVTRRQIRPAITAAASAAGTVLVGLVAMPGPTWRYFTQLAFQAQRVGHPGFVGNQSLDGALTRLTGSYATAHPYWLAAALVALVLGLWTARGVQVWLGEPYGLALVALTGLLVSPISWSHHWVWWAVPAVALVWRVYQRRNWLEAALAVVCALPFYIGPFWRIAPRNIRRLPLVGWQHSLGDAYVIEGVVILLVSAASLRAANRADAAEATEAAAAGGADPVALAMRSSPARGAALQPRRVWRRIAKG
ncbi:MAG: hypothetical protein JWM89_1112 [Acidimicrobiales bacterium]|nr:hypothetical protein [Acidimicrobiales bacterium]